MQTPGKGAIGTEHVGVQLRALIGCTRADTGTGGGLGLYLDAPAASFQHRAGCSGHVHNPYPQRGLKIDMCRLSHCDTGLTIIGHDV